MKIYLASDHAGFELKNRIKEFLTHEGHTIEDCGAFSYEPTDDYPDFIAKAAEAVSKCEEGSPSSFLASLGTRSGRLQCGGIVIGGSGQGEAMVANRYKNVRAAVFYSPAIALASAGGDRVDPLQIVRLSREHNDANVLSIGARFVKEKDALEAVKIWLETPFSGDPRHVRRIDKF